MTPTGMTRALRFGFQLSGRHLEDPVGAARRAEEIGFDIVLASDHVGSDLAPMPLLAAVATATERIRVGTFVLNNDMRNPVQLAWEAATLDQLSGGRFELGLGAGHTPQEYVATGIPMDAAAVRKERLIESIRTIRREFDSNGIDGLPILVGGNGARLLGAAGELADIVGLQGLGRTLEDGHSHAVRWSVEHLESQLGQIRSGAGARFDDIELNALVQAFELTDDRDGALARVAEQVDGLTLDDARSTPYMLVGSLDQIVEHIHLCADRWGITYFVVRELDAFEPVISSSR
jgi:probable F420-dependent oxidoreductase